MILSSCGCKVSWALPRGMRHLRMPLPVLRFAVSIQTAKTGMVSSLFTSIFCAQSSAHIHLKLCGFFDGDGDARGQQPMRVLVCQPQERGTLLSQLPRRNSPTIALRNAAPVKVFLPCLFPFFLGRCRLIPGIELPVQHGVELLLQALTDFFFVIILTPQMVHGEVEKQIIGDLHGFHLVSLLSATVATIATAVLVVLFSPLQPSQPSRSLFRRSYEGQRDTPPLVSNLVLITDVVFIQQSARFDIQILTQRICCHADVNGIGKLGG